MALEVFERKFLRRIYGEKEVQSHWKRKTNEEQYGEPSITDMTGWQSGIHGRNIKKEKRSP